MIYKQHKMGAYNIHTIKTERFKNIQIEVVFRNNIEKERTPIRATLFDVLMDNNKNYPTNRDLILRQEELYNCYPFSVTYKLGNEIITSVGMDMLNPKYADYNYLSDAISFLFDIIFNPNLKDDEFDEKTINMIKTRNIAEIKTEKENPGMYAFDRALQAMDKDSVTAIKVLGEVEDIESITSKQLYEEYNNILEHDYVDIFVIGDFEENEMIDIISKYAKFTTIKTHEITTEVENRTVKKIKEVKEESNNSQSHIVMVLNALNLTNYEKKYAFQLFYMILGGGSLDTKLYQKLRGENSLCYGLRSYYEKHDNLLLITTSVDKKNVSLAIKLIKETIKEMKDQVTDEEVSNAVNNIVSSINMTLDSPGRIIDEYLFRYITDLDDIDTRIETYKKVTKEEVMSLINKISLNTIFVLEGGDKVEED